MMADNKYYKSFLSLPSLVNTIVIGRSLLLQGNFSEFLRLERLVVSTSRFAVARKAKKLTIDNRELATKN